ncbi:MAG: hypothetical protein LBF97_00680 [Elusimicrobiota bacterium]|jgi:hypothetical protein|nr:hypothetical protein [Elusimicrobiota bacterium]
MKILNEWKEDLEQGNKILHYTNAKGLQKILESKKLKAIQYDFSLDKDESKEVAFVRKSASPIKRTNKRFSENVMADKMRKITDKDVDAEIIVDTDILKNSIRGVKQSPIAEYVIKSLIYFKRCFNDIFKLLQNKPVAQRSIFTKTWDESEYKKNINKFIQDYEKVRGFLKTYAHDLILKGEVENSTKLNDLNNTIYFHIGLYKKYIYQKEGEERVNKDVPLNNKYLQIRLLEPILTSTYKNDEYLRKLVKQNNILFVKDKIYDSYLGSLKENTYLKRIIITT